MGLAWGHLNSSGLSAKRPEPTTQIEAHTREKAMRQTAGFSLIRSVALPLLEHACRYSLAFRIELFFLHSRITSISETSPKKPKVS